jgi:CRP-like cAMP-binding protein
MAFGELAYVDRSARTADVRADSQVECRTLPYTLLDDLAVSDPALHGRLILNILRVAVSWVHVTSSEVRHLAR